MEIKFIGTGSGKTSLERFHSSILFLSKDYYLLIDTGDGISKALLSQNIPYNSINGILISHLHPDHFSGLSALIIQMKLTKRKSKLDIFVHESLVEVVKDFICHSYIFNEKLDFVIDYIPFCNEKSYEITGSFKFMAKQNTHLEPYRIYDSSNKLSFSCSSFLFTVNGKNIHYTGDVGNADDLFLFEKFNNNTLISEISHINILDLIKIADFLNIERLVLTHISDEDEPSLLKLGSYKNGKSKFDIIAAYDGLAVTI